MVFLKWVILGFRSAAREFVWVIIGLILGVALSGPIKLLLMHIKPFYFLDDIAPRIESVSPALSTKKLINELPSSIIARVYDEGIGLDTGSCLVEILGQEGRLPSRIDCIIDKSDSIFKISPIDSVGIGSYMLRIRLIDKARNSTNYSFPFVIIKEKQIISARRGKCSEKEKAAYFSDYLDSQKKYSFRPQRYDYYVLEIFLSNKTKKGYLKDIYFSADIGNIVLSCKFLGGIDVKGFEAYNCAESMDRMMTKFQIFTSEWLFRIDEIAPMGLARIKLLIGLHNVSGSPDQLYNSIGIHGSYVFDGYGIHETRELNQEVPVQF